MKEEDKKSKFNTANERMKYKYRKHIQHVGRKDIKTVIEDLKPIIMMLRFAMFTIFFVSQNPCHLSHQICVRFAISLIG